MLHADPSDCDDGLVAPEAGCTDCGGDGYVVELEHAFGCSNLKGGPCDSPDCPWPVQAPCPGCR